MSCTKYIHDALTHRVITSRPVALTNPWHPEWITEAIADYFERKVEDVDCTETDDGEFFTIDGERVAYVETN